MFSSLWRTVVLYLALIGAIRLMGKRQIGQMEPSEFVVTMLVANLASIPIEEKDIPITGGLIPIGIVLVLELALSLVELRSVKLRRLLCGKPVILIENGKILPRNLRRTRITLDELTSQLRLKNILRPETVQYAILETNGSLSVFPYPKEMPASAKDAGIHVRQQHLPITIIADGYLYTDNLPLAKLDGKALEKILQQHSATIAGTFLLTIDARGKVLWLPKDQV